MFLGILKVIRMARIIQQVLKIKGKDRNSQPNREQHKDIPLKKKKKKDNSSLWNKQNSELEGWAFENLTFSKQISGPPDPRGVFSLWIHQGQRPRLGRHVELMGMASASAHRETQAPLPTPLSCCPDWPSAQGRDLWPPAPASHQAPGWFQSHYFSAPHSPLVSQPLHSIARSHNLPYLHKKRV